VEPALGDQVGDLVGDAGVLVDLRTRIDAGVGVRLRVGRGRRVGQRTDGDVEGHLFTDEPVVAVDHRREHVRERLVERPGLAGGGQPGGEPGDGVLPLVRHDVADGEGVTETGTLAGRRPERVVRGILDQRDHAPAGAVVAVAAVGLQVVVVELGRQQVRGGGVRRRVGVDRPRLVVVERTAEVAERGREVDLAHLAVQGFARLPVLEREGTGLGVDEVDPLALARAPQGHPPGEPLVPRPQGETAGVEDDELRTGQR
jgi:hypothetical protein